MASASSVPVDKKVVEDSGTFNHEAGFSASAEVKEVDSMAVLKLMMPRERNLQFRAIISIALLFVSRVANIMIPLSFKGLVDNLSLLGGGQTLVASSSTTAVNMALQFMIMFVGWKLLQTLSDVLRQYAWVRVASDLRRRTSETLLAHLHSLSMRFHVTSKSGEVLQIIDKGTTGIERLMEVLPFRLFPALVDVVLVCLVLLSQGQPVIASITGATIISYAIVTWVVTKWRTKYWRAMVMSELVYKGRAVESLQNFETVKYFASDKHELRQFSGMVKEWQGRQLTSERSLAILNVAQKIIVCVGLASALYVATGSVAAGTMTVGGLVMTATYMEQLHVPLSWLGTIYRMVEDSYVDMERMFSLLDRKPEVADLEGAQELVVAKGLVEFVNVSFSYESSRSVLNGVSFRVEPGKTLALVGESGGGKSTIGRLLFRLYDVTSGSVLIDGVDIRNVTQASVRSSIGVVPQETTLFNSELGYNIRYGGVSGEELPSNQEDVEKAARSAMLHERVLTFEDGYATIVGEKGLRLSGGERQRVGIARTLIKEPRIMLLDEATSALDTQTETQIQAALAQATKGRTAIVIAHRLSTVVDADEIAVMRGGKIVERGRHEDLLARRGMYAKMWDQQVRVSVQKQRLLEAEERVTEDHPEEKVLVHAHAGGPATDLEAGGANGTLAGKTWTQVELGRE